MSWGALVIARLLPLIFATNINESTILDFGELPDDIFGTGLTLLQHPHHDKSSYKFEDFFWTGSGDGSPYEEENQWVLEGPTTVFKTTTLTTTIFTEKTTSVNNTKPADANCPGNCQVVTSTEKINPTPTDISYETTTEVLPNDTDNFIDADREYWIVTVIKTDGKDPMINDLKSSLTKLYKKAFQRQQDYHLGITNQRKRRAAEKPVKVYIHNVDKKKLNGDHEVQVLYHVAVSGKPVAATTAAADMRLISDEEVVKELGYPFVVKAEPYLKSELPQGLSRAKNTWIFIGVSIVSLLILLLIVAFLSLGCTKKRNKQLAVENRRQIFERDVDKENGHSPTYINFRNQPSAQTIRSAITTKTGRGYLSASSSSSTSLDISPLMNVHKHRVPPKKPPRPKAALNKTVPLNVRRLPPELYDSDSGDSRKQSPDTFYVRGDDAGITSPKSYLSMPSVKSFPRVNNPEPLNKVLEPVSILHLDMPEEHLVIQPKRSSLTRHGSIGADDPGVIGPVVWDIHCQNMQHGISLDEGMEGLRSSKSIKNMRKRFHELLDDTFSLFGSKRNSPVDRKPNLVEIKSKSAVGGDIRPTEDLRPTIQPRAKTAGIKPRTPSSIPKGAWDSSTHSPALRPASAGPVAPRINVDHVLAEGKFRENDPAVPLIAAIKTELEKCSLPGSTSDLNQ